MTSAMLQKQGGKECVPQIVESSAGSGAGTGDEKRSFLLFSCHSVIIFGWLVLLAQHLGLHG